MNILKLLYSFKGQIGRLAYAQGFILSITITIVLYLLHMRILQTAKITPENSEGFDGLVIASIFSMRHQSFGNDFGS